MKEEEKEEVDKRVSILGKLFMPFITEIDNDKEPDKLGSIIVGVISGVIMVGIIVWLIFFNKLG